MALSRNRRSERTIDYWPGFVDALSTLLLAIMFLLSVFVLAQFLLSRELSGRDAVLDRLNSQINELTQLLSLERGTGQDFQDQIASLQASLQEAEENRSRLQRALDSGEGAAASAGAEAGQLRTQLEGERAISQRAAAQVELLNQQLTALRQQIAALEDALNASESRDRESQTRIADLGSRLNVALAQRVQELSRYRSDFFGRLREILSDRENIRIVGDRFVFQSEVLFASGSDILQPAGTEEMRKLAAAIVELAREIPSDINWIIRVDGHTDTIPITGTGGRFADNWQLSTARAAAVVRYLISQGAPANRLAATGFGEFQPIDPADTPAARSRNRRIELKLTER
jgi:chemotaxis protein MotB